MVKNRIKFYKDGQSCALMRVHINDNLQTERLAKARYFNDNNYRSEEKSDDKRLPPISNGTRLLHISLFISFLVSNARYTQTHSIPTSSTSSILQRRPERWYVIEDNSKLLNRSAGFNTSKAGDFLQVSGNEVTDRNWTKPTRRRKGMLSRVYHYIVAPAIIKEAQWKQHEEVGDDSLWFLCYWSGWKTSQSRISCVCKWTYGSVSCFLTGYDQRNTSQSTCDTDICIRICFSMDMNSLSFSDLISWFNCSCSPSETIIPWQRRFLRAEFTSNSNRKRIYLWTIIDLLYDFYYSTNTN